MSDLSLSAAGMRDEEVEGLYESGVPSSTARDRASRLARKGTEGGAEGVFGSVREIATKVKKRSFPAQEMV